MDFFVQEVAPNSLSLSDRLKQLLEKDKIEDGLSATKLDASRKRVIGMLDKSISEIHSVADLIALFKEIDRLFKIGSYLSQSLIGEALRHVDILQPIRSNYTQLSSTDKNKLLRALASRENKKDENGTSTWSPYLSALKILDNSAQAPEIVSQLLDSKQNLLNDFEWSGYYVNRSFFKSLQDIPENIQLTILGALSKRLDTFDRWYNKQNFSDESERVNAKESRRSLQFLQRILLEKEFTEMTELIKNTRGNAERIKAALFKIESYCEKIKMDTLDYHLDTVIEIAKIFKRKTDSLFQSKDSLEIFGSFPNLAAKRKTSDIDLIFNGRFEALYYHQIKGGEYGEGKLSQPADLTTSDGRELLDTLLAIDKEARHVFSSSVTPGDLLSVSALPRSHSRRGEVIETTYSELLKFFTQISPVTVLINKDKIVLRIYDSINVAPHAKPNIYQIEINI
ncbi:MAG: hypothetical protein H6623_09755 [Bdellovibrionaceae bacterium]|nr:hypothetical protein [Pseudobdellovibrionaceae bacterium]